MLRCRAPLHLRRLSPAGRARLGQRCNGLRCLWLSHLLRSCVTGLWLGQRWWCQLSQADACLLRNGDGVQHRAQG
jgi:hypothetical protein